MSSSLVSDDLIPIAVTVDDAMIRVEFNGGLQIATPVMRFPRLVKATAAQRSHWRLIGRGDGIHWPDVDEDISVRTLLSQPARKPVDRMQEVPALIADLMRTTQRLNKLFQGRPFTPDGHLVGSIGEVVAEYVYGVRLEPCSTPHIDAVTEDGRTVQIKLTGESGKSYGFRWSDLHASAAPDLLIALKLRQNGFTEIYAGRFPVELLSGRKRPSNGQLPIPVKKLEELGLHDLKQINSIEDLNRWFALPFGHAA